MEKEKVINNSENIKTESNANKKTFNKFKERGSFFDRRQQGPQYNFEVLKIRPVARVRSGGVQRRMAVLSAVFDPVHKRLGIGQGKASEVPTAIAKSERDAIKNFKKISLFKESISHNNQINYKNLKVIMIQTNGKGIISGFIPRKILSLVGIKSVTCKCIGKSKSPDLIAAAIWKCLTTLESVGDVANRLGKTVPEILERKK